MGSKSAKALAFEETVVLDSKTMRQTADGYMVASPRIARTGIQEYLGIEMGRPDLEKVRVYRPEGEVFARDALRSLSSKPVTIEHPDVPVTSKNWRDFAVGHVGEDVIRDGEFIRVPLVLMDANAIEEVKSGRAQLSVGYSAVIQWADGVTPGGEKYDATQTAIRANHVALTHTARGGPKLRMGDNRRTNMATRTIMVDNLPIELEDRDALMVERHISKLAADLATAQTALATAQTTAQNDVAVAKTEAATAKAEVQTKDAEIVTLKKQLDDSKIKPADLDQMVTERVNTVQRAKAIIGDTLVIDGKTVADMRKQVVLAKLGDVAKDWNDDMIKASFNTLTVVPDSGSHNGLQHVVSVIQNSDTTGIGDARAKAYADYETDLSNRWKTAGARTAS
jgi:uncharacterized protein